MTFFKELVLGLRMYVDAHQFIRKNRLWGYVLIPGMINLVLFITSIYFGWEYTSQLTEWFFEQIGLDPHGDGSSILAKLLNFIILMVLRLATVMVYLMVYKYIVLILMAPVLALLSEKTEELATGKKFPFDPIQFLRDVLRGIIIALRNIGLELTITAILLLLAHAPVVGLAVPFIIFGVQSYYYGFSMIDYYSERQKMSIGRSIDFVNRHRGFAVANGAVFYGLLVIPIVGLLVAPSYAIVAATLGALNISKDGER